MLLLRDQDDVRTMRMPICTALHSPVRIIGTLYGPSIRISSPWTCVHYILPIFVRLPQVPSHFIYTACPIRCCPD